MTIGIDELATCIHCGERYKQTSKYKGNYCTRCRPMGKQSWFDKHGKQ